MAEVSTSSNLISFTKDDAINKAFPSLEDHFFLFPLHDVFFRSANRRLYSLKVCLKADFLIFPFAAYSTRRELSSMSTGFGGGTDDGE